MLAIIEILFLIIAVVNTTPQSDLVKSIPGYPQSFQYRVFAGYLQTQSALRKIHYIFMQSLSGQSNKDPVVLWMNGGPGCSSKLGFLQQIAPYFLPVNTPYSENDSLTQNVHSWQKIANLIFLDSPAGVGFSINSDSQYKHSDSNTASDNLAVMVKLFNEKFPQYRGNDFYIAGESYAGKYIPDLAVNIDNHNAINPKQMINLKGILLGNPVIGTQKQILASRVQFMISHNLIDPKLRAVWERSCKQDQQSAGCSFFKTRFDDLVGDLDQYNIYGPCYKTTPSQRNFILSTSKSNFSRQFTLFKNKESINNLEADCSYNRGVQDYFTINYETFKSTVRQFKVCSSSILQNYERTESGSKQQLIRLIQTQGIKVWFYSGDWDDVIPFTNTQQQIQGLGLKQQAPSQPFQIDGQHAGFFRNFTSGVRFYLVKAAGHQVPQYQRKTAYYLFQKFLSEK